MNKPKYFYGFGISGKVSSPVYLLGLADQTTIENSKAVLVERKDESRIVLNNNNGVKVIKPQFAGMCLIPDKGEIYLHKWQEDDGQFIEAMKINEPSIMNIKNNAGKLINQRWQYTWKIAALRLRKGCI